MLPCTRAARRSRSAWACWPAAASPPGGAPLASLAPASPAALPGRAAASRLRPAPLPAGLAAELISVLAALALPAP